MRFDYLLPVIAFGLVSTNAINTTSVNVTSERAAPITNRMSQISESHDFIVYVVSCKRVIFPLGSLEVLLPQFPNAKLRPFPDPHFVAGMANSCPSCQFDSRCI